MRECPICDNKNIIAYDCGYSSFNCGDHHCSVCGFTIHWGFTNKDCLINSYKWNDGVKKFDTIWFALSKLTNKELEALDLLEYKQKLNDYIKECKIKSKKQKK